MPMMRRQAFERLVRRVFASLPPPVLDQLANVDIVVRDRPTEAQIREAGLSTRDTLLGLYQGTPISKRGAYYQMVLPDRITLFQEPLESVCATDEELEEQVRRTLLHEIAHHLGIDEERLAELESD